MIAIKWHFLEPLMATPGWFYYMCASLCVGGGGGQREDCPSLASILGCSATNWRGPGSGLLCFPLPSPGLSALCLQLCKVTRASS